MGKIRIKTIGDEELEQEEKKKQKQRKEAKLSAAKSTSGEKAEKAELKSENSAKQNIETDIQPEVKTEPSFAKATEGQGKKQVKQKEQKAFHSQKYQSLLSLVDRTKTYTLSEALEMLEKLQRKNLPAGRQGFDETVELHLNTISTGVSGNITLPHGTGKKTKVAIATDAIVAEIEKGIINFDILIAEPQIMAKLARVAKILGPRGLMPNPKNGTITANPQEALKKYEGGQINFKTEAKSPIMHLTAGKMSFGKEKLTQNIESLITAIKKSNIVNATLKSTMSPGIKIKI